MANPALPLVDLEQVRIIADTPLFVARGTHSSKVTLYSSNTIKPPPHLTRETCWNRLNDRLPYEPWMPMNGDKETMYKYLQQTKDTHKPMTYLEWGCGGSTFAALRYADHVVSIENSKAWCDKVVNTEVAQCNILLGRLHFICVDAGETSPQYARPLDQDNYNFSLYTNVMDHFEYSADFVFIDGRLRLATALASMKHSKKDSVTLVHDYYDRPGLFSDLEKFFYVDFDYKLPSKRATMAVFRKKPIINKQELETVWDKHKHSLKD